MRIRHWIGLVLSAASFMAVGCETLQPQAAKESAPQIFKGLGSYHRAATTTNAEAQRYFDQALTWTYSFNHDEAIRSYTEAARLDPNFAAAWWGVALCNGPHINNPVMDEEHSKAAWEALQKAEGLKDKASAEERALIEALGARYADPAKGKLPLTPEERAPLDKAYADAMAKVHDQFPRDVDLATLYVESLMDTHPWDLWNHDGTPKEWTPRIVSTLESVLAASPDHPGANHLYVHAVEASGHPEKGLASADRLCTLVPASGHMVHMPAHIYIHVSHWDKAAEQNRVAIAADKAYRALSPRQGFYAFYMAHNHQFLSYACMMEGRSGESISAAHDMVTGVPDAFIQNAPAVIDGYMHIEIEALLRFGKWDELLALKQPPAILPIYTAFWRYGRATAYNAKGMATEAEHEQAEFRKAVEAVPAEAMMAQNKGHVVLKLADHALAGEIAFRRGSIDDAVSHLTEAVKIEDGLNYMEPPDWVWPVRHSLGAVLLSAGRNKEAEAVYREDLKRWPDNGWSLYGLSKALAAQGSPEAAEVEARFKKAWARADIQIGSSCLCAMPVK
jgi:tetratricopeptide (TPR) repeat protein